MFYYPVNNNMLEPVTHMQARQLLAKKLKERDLLGAGESFSIWAGKSINCTKFSCVEDLDDWVAYLSSKELPILPHKKRS